MRNHDNTNLPILKDMVRSPLDTKFSNFLMSSLHSRTEGNCSVVKKKDPT